jgi:hypothetical protein
MIVVASCGDLSNDTLERTEKDEKTQQTMEFEATDYYMRGEEKIPLQKMNNRYLVMVHAEDKDKLIAELAKANLKLIDKDVWVSTLYSNYGIELSPEPTKDEPVDLMTVTVEGGFEQIVKALSYIAIHYSSKYKTSDGLELWLTNRFAVKLKFEKGSVLPEELEACATKSKNLEKLARENAVTIIGASEFLEGWYYLICTNLSKGNALEMANLFYESGLFEVSEPSFIGYGSIY